MRASSLLALLAPWAITPAQAALAPARASHAGEPRFTLSSSLRPVVKLRKRLRTLCIGCDYHVVDRRASFETTWRDTLVGGDLAFNMTQLQWTKAWYLPGLADAATRVELRSVIDFRTGRGDAELRLGLRRSFSKRGLSLVHQVDVGGTGHCKVDVGATLTVPDELQLSAQELLRPSPTRGRSGDARFGIDVDRLDLRLDF